tara:strand:+ start:26303 stop:26995 length:693 start_codon:yes stop_codon:yes gene_type:complete
MEFSVKVKLFRILLVITALAIIFFATKYAFANLSYLKVDSYLTRWQKTKVVDKLEMQDALTSVDSMLSLHGHFPHYLNVAAKVYEWRAFTHGDDQATYESYLLTAFGYYLKSSQLRSHWPLTWAFMANIKSNLNQLDDDFYYYIDQSIKYGPYTHEVNLQIAKLQLLYWGRLDKLPIKVGLEQIKRALLNNNSVYLLLDYANAIDRSAIVCTVARLNKIERVVRHKSCKP